MALEILRREIFRRTAPLKFPSNEAVARTFYLIVSPSMSHLRDWYQKWFPVADEDLRQIQPWIICKRTLETSDLNETVGNACLSAFNIDTVNALTAKGFRVLDTANQVILVCDLTEEGAVENMEKLYTSFKEVFDRFMSHRVPVYFTGLFLIRNIEKGDDGKVTVKNAAEFNRKITWMQDKLNKVFLVDVSNPCGAVVSKVNDLHFFLGQLLYILTKKPIEFAIARDSAGFGEWVNRDCPSDGKCGGFSGISMLSPIDQITETLLMAKGGEVLEEAFLGGYQEEKPKAYLVSLLNKAFLNSEDVFRGMLVENKTIPLIDPFSNLQEEKGKWDVNHPEVFTGYIDSLDARLPRDAMDNRRIMQNLSQKLLADFRYQLLEHLNAAIINEKGGLLIAEKFLEELKKQISALIPEKVPAPVYPDISNLIAVLGNKCKQGPRREAVATRTIILALVAFAGALSSKEIFDLPSIIFPILTLIAVGGGVLYWYSTKSTLERLVSDIWTNLFEKWNKLMAKESGEIFRDILPKYISIIDEMSSQVTAASKRLREITSYFRNEYYASIPDNSAFWIYALNSRDDMMKYISSLRVDVSATASDYLINERPLELWNRVASPGTDLPNEWEWRLGESIALKLLPLSQEIINLSICRILKDNPGQIRNFAEVLKRSAEPFLNVKAGTGRCSVKGSFEVPKEGCEDVYNKLLDSIHGDFTHIDRSDSLTPYRISLFSFAENVEFDALKVEG